MKARLVLILLPSVMWGQGLLLFTEEPSDSANKGAYLGSIAMIGDRQIQYRYPLTGSPNVYTNGGITQMDTALAYIKRNNPYSDESIDLVVALGDVVDDSEDSSWAYDSTRVYYRDELFPDIHFPGNHDAYDSNKVNWKKYYDSSLTYNNWQDTLTSYLYGVTYATGRVYFRGRYTPDFDANLVLLIDPRIKDEAYINDAGVEDFDLSWISDVVRDSIGDNKTIFYLTHYPVWYESGGHPKETNATAFRDTLRALETNNRQIICFNGHRNTFRAKIENGLHLWQTAAHNKEGKGKRPNIIFIDVYENKIHIRNYSIRADRDGDTQESVADAIAEDTIDGITLPTNWYKNGFWFDRYLQDGN